MKLRSVNKNSYSNAASYSNNNIKYQNKVSYNNFKNSSNTSFTGMTDMLVGFWQGVENGGRALQFTVEDMGGTNFPRTIMGMLAGYKYTHKININSFLQEGIREFLTGPTMTFMPMLILLGMKQGFGKSANTHVENIRNLTYLADGCVDSSANQLKQDDFYRKVVTDLLDKTINSNSTSHIEVDKDDIDNLTNAVTNYSDLLLADGKKDKKGIKKALDEAQGVFSSIIKNRKENYGDTDFVAARYSKDAKNVGSTKFKSYIEYLVSYKEDFNKFGAKQNNGIEPKEILNKFSNKFVGRRVATVTTMVVVTGALMSLIPKLYTLASGSINPNAKEIYNQADKKTNDNTDKQQAKEAK